MNPEQTIALLFALLPLIAAFVLGAVLLSRPKDATKAITITLAPFLALVLLRGAMGLVDQAQRENAECPARLTQVVVCYR